MSAVRTLLLLSGIALAAAPALPLAGCGGEPAATAGGDIDPARARELGAVAKRIQADPGQADAILGEAGLSRAEFEAALYTIASDPALSKAYTDAL